MHEDSETRVELLVEFQTTQTNRHPKFSHQLSHVIRDSVVALSFTSLEKRRRQTAFLVK